MTTIKEIPLADITTNGNVRFDVGDISILAASIDRIGLLQPITVQPNPEGGSKYLLVAGHRRFAAHQHLGWKAIEAIVTNDVTTDGTRIEIQLAENLMREDLTPVEKAQALLDLKDQGYNQKAIATATGFSTKDVSAYQKLGRSLVDHDTSELKAAIAGYDEQQLLGLARDVEEEAIAPVLSMFSEKDPYGERVYWDISDAYLDWKRGRERIERNAAITAELTALTEAGITVVEITDGNTPGVSLREVSQQKSWPSYMVNGVDPLILDTATHRGLDCHVVAVLPGYNGQRIPSERCTDPESHLAKDAELKAINKASTKAIHDVVTSTGEKAARTRRFNVAYREGAQRWADGFKVSADEARTMAIDVIKNEMPYGWEKRTAKLLGFTDDNAGDWLVSNYVTGTTPAKQLEGWLLLYVAQAIESQYHSQRSIPVVAELVKELKTAADKVADAK